MSEQEMRLVGMAPHARQASECSQPSLATQEGYTHGKTSRRHIGGKKVAVESRAPSAWGGCQLPGCGT